jgi:hypothetical protein
MSPVDAGISEPANLRAARRWWRTVSRTMQPTAPVLSTHIASRVSGLAEAWDEKCTETSDLVTVFVAGLSADELGDHSADRFGRVAEKLRWRELRALLVSHLASEITENAQKSAQPLIDELERIGLFDHRPALLAGDLAGFDHMCTSRMPALVVPGAYSALVRAIDEGRAAPVDSFLDGVGVMPVDQELRTLLNGDQTAIARRLDQALAVRRKPVPGPARVVLDISADDRGVEVPTRTGAAG